ncbi:MAG: lysophospholipid acyltransferase family protein [Campylobacterota bacterium]|nr:lysophospholipid acyltransferase family protein [Campylobacterota bacterium]
MLRKIFKLLFMIKHGLRYVKIFKQTYFHPFVTYKQGYKQLSLDRQNYSNKILKNLNIEVKLVGNIPKQNKVLYAINHRSLLDILVLENIFEKHGKNGTWIAKHELFEHWLYGDFFRYSGCISVDLQNPKKLLSFFKMIKSTLSKIDDFNIYIFPEGERHKNKGLLKFQSGAAKIAKANKLDIVPVFIHDELEVIFDNAPYEKTKIVKVYMGDLIDHKELEDHYINFMNETKDKHND